MKSAIAELGGYTIFVARCFRATLRHGLSWRSILREAHDIGVRSLPLLMIIGAFVGTNLALQGWLAFQPLGGQRMLGMFVCLAGVREIAPIITAAMVAAKAGTEMASQISVMRINEQIDAMEVMAVNPLAQLVAPRLCGIIVALPALTIISTFVMLGSALTISATQLGLSPHDFLTFGADGMSAHDLLYGQIKSLVFGLLICTIACFQGFRSDAGPAGVGRATNRAVVTASVAIVVSNYLLSEWLYGSQA